MNNIKAILHYDVAWDRNDLYIKFGDNKILQPLVIAHREVGDKYEPCLRGEGVTDFVQAIMDAGWRAGLKPSGYEDASRELTAVKYHLEDMRKLALNTPPHNGEKEEG